jgi:SAM-dependent methyltransferase
MFDPYWDDFYKTLKKDTLTLPSQFACFALMEMGEIKNIIEFGCGNGRDSFFFASYQKSVVAVDASSEAIARNSERFKNLLNIKFLCCDVTGELPEEIIGIESPKVLYARFFLHAIDNGGIDNFLTNCAGIMTEKDKLFMEYRTSEDEFRRKELKDHFRNYLKPKGVERLLVSKGFQTQYFVEGVGFAKWKKDDASVARHVCIIK